MTRKQRKRRERQCGNKRKYQTKDEAYRVMHKVLENNFVFHKLNVYQCKYCGSWHFGHGRQILIRRFDELIK